MKLSVGQLPYKSEIGGGISMIKVENKSRKEIADIGRRIGEAFADEKPFYWQAIMMRISGFYVITYMRWMAEF